jgi:hypothetical protein
MMSYVRGVAVKEDIPGLGMAYSVGCEGCGRYWLHESGKVWKMIDEPAPPVDRKAVLLRAAYDLLKKQDESGTVLNLLGETVFYDGTDCDGSCLMEDIKNELGLKE